jgi:DNA-binding transcriptional LysR family regulator
LDYLVAIRLFVRSVELGSFSKAAIAFDLKASSVSRHVSSLEQDLGATLFRRSTRQLLLTDAGTAFYDRASNILKEIEDARRATVAAVSEPIGNLKIWAPLEFGTQHVSALLPKFMAQTPGLSVDFTLGDADQDQSSVHFDLFIKIGEPSDSRFYAQRFARNQYVICCAPSYLERTPEPGFPSALRDHNCLVHGNRQVWQFGSAKSTVEVSVEIAGNFRSNQLRPVLAAALTGAGFARLPLWIAGEHLRNGQLITVLNRYEVISEDNAIYGIYPEKRSVSPKIRTFIEFLTSEWGSPPKWEL